MKTELANYLNAEAEKTKTLQQIERMEQIAQDTRKMFTYHGAKGIWTWCDRGDQHTQYGLFDTRLEALRDAVEPYLTEPDCPICGRELRTDEQSGEPFCISCGLDYEHEYTER